MFCMTRRLETVVDNLDKFGFAMADANTNDIITEQKGVFRTNCLDWCVVYRTWLCFVSLNL